MLTNALKSIIMPECIECKECCKNISGKSEIICGYNAIEEININHIDESLIMSFIVYRISNEDLDAAAKNWGLYPLVNLIKYITIPTGDYYELLAIPPGDCPFNTPMGCANANLKPFECSMYPFYLYKLEFRNDYRCRFLYNQETMISTKDREAIGQFIVDYILYSVEHKQQYFDKLIELKQKYNLKVIQFTT